MANLTPSATFDDVFQLETTSVALGGPGATMNLQAQALVNRTQYLYVQLSNLASVASTGDYNSLINRPALGSAAYQPSSTFATAAQGAKADGAAQASALSAVAFSGSYNDLTGKPFAADAPSDGNPATAYMAAAGATDITTTWQAALNAMEALGGGTIIMGPGTHTISIANADNAYACLRIPANVTIEGPASAIFTRPASERTTDGVLLVNKYWDTNGGYTAAGNITLRGFTITDGGTVGQHTVGDLIGLGHCDGALIENVHGGNHDQHLVDICGSKNIVVRSCTDNNQATGSYRGSATVQIDWAHSLGISGMVLDDTITTDVLIENPNFVNAHSDFVVQMGHNGGTFKRICVRGGTLDGGYASGDQVIGIDSTCSLEAFDVDGVTIIVNHKDARAGNWFLAGSSGQYADGLNVRNCKVRGAAARSGMYFGINNTYAGTGWPNFRGLVVENNDVEVAGDTTLSNSNIYGMWILGWVGIVHGNQIKVTAANDAKEIYGIVADRNRRLIVSDNDVSIELTSPTGASLVTNFMARCDVPAAIGASNIVFRGNTANLGTSSARYGLNFANGTTGWTCGTDKVLFSNNAFVGTPRTAHIYEQYAASDGTNGWHQIDFGSGTYVKTLASGQAYSGISLGLKKVCATDSNISPAKFEWAYAPLAATGLANDREALTFNYLSSTTVVGTQVVDVDQGAGTFGLLTGVSGVTIVIDNSTFQPVVRTSGYLSGFGGI